MSLLNLLLGGGLGNAAPAASSALQSDVPPVQPQPVSPIVVQGDNFHPSSPGWLGQALDTILMLKGKQPVFQQRKANEDLARVMPDFQSNPEQTIHRIAQIPGQANNAYHMQEQYTTDQERDQSRDIRDAAKSDMITTRLGGMAGAATEKNWPAMHKLMTDYVTRWGMKPEDFDIPDNYDPDALDAMSNGAITAKDQQAQSAREQALALRGQAIDSTNQYRQARLGQINTAEADRNSRFQQGQASVQGRFNTNQARLVGKGSHQTLMTKYGPGMLSPDGNQMIVTNPKTGGRQYGYVKAGDQWVPVGETAASKKAHGE